MVFAFITLRGLFSIYHNMPLVVITGCPSSGKTQRTQQLKTYFEEEHQKTVHVVSENQLIASSGQEKNSIFSESPKEKALRGQVKSEATRLVGKDTLVIIDAGNYIKGFRYEIFCMVKSSKTPQCTVHVTCPIPTAWQWNEARDEKERYSKEIFDALVMRYEEPDSRNRWDSPLFVVHPDSKLPRQDLFSALYERKPPPPNQSTQCAPLASTNYLYELDRITQDITSVVLSAQKLGAEGDIRVPGFSESVHLPGGAKLTPPQLSRIRRQFLTYSKLHPASEASRIGPLFIQFLNTNLT